GAEGRHDEQDAVCSECSRMDDLVRVYDEILAQHRQRARGPGLAQVIVGTLEILHVGQHRQAGRTVRGVAVGDFNRVEILANHALGRRGLFHLGDDARLPLGDLVFDGTPETSQVLAALGLAQEVGLTAHLTRRADLYFLGFEYFGEDVVHADSFSV